MSLITFQEALAKAQGCTTKHLLLGNGFSIACVPTIFTYRSLFDEADFSSYPEIRLAFQLLDTTDFELVIHALEKAATVVPAYDNNSQELLAKMKTDALAIKDLLISTIASRHPAYPSEITEDSYSLCRTFLSHFIHKDNKGRIYSLNYDLLLYWTLMHELDDKQSVSQFSDGFGRDSWFENGESYASDILTWQGKSSSQNIHYLHGALHLYDKGDALQKFSWNDKGLSLIDQSRQAMIEGKFPLFVTEGDNFKKMEKINHNPYLFNSYKSFEDMSNAGIGKVGNTCLFTYGVSFSDNDKHIFNKIAGGRIKQMYVGIYGDINSLANRSIVALAEALKGHRSQHSLEIIYYCARSANVWNK